MAHETVVGDWGKFVFKMIEPEDHLKVLEHLRSCLYYPAFFRIGYTKDMDDEWENFYREILSNGSNLSFIALDKATGKIAACRMMDIENLGHKAAGESPFKNRINKGLTERSTELMKDFNLFERYKTNSYPHMLGMSVDPEFAQQGLATEIYGRAIRLLKSLGYPVAFVSFISPYSRAAGKHHGFIEMARKSIIELMDDNGDPLYPHADPNDFLDLGVFELH